MASNPLSRLSLSEELLDAIRSFPVERQVEHCGREFASASLDLYATCPHCGARLKLRSYSGSTEIEDVFDALVLWMSRPGAQETARRRLAVLLEDDEADGEELATLAEAPLGRRVAMEANQVDDAENLAAARPLARSTSVAHD